MNVLIVHTHPEPKSFCSALKDAAVATFSAAGHQVVTSDLYAMNFNPVASAADFTDRQRSDYLFYALEQRHATKHQAYAKDIEEEIAKVVAADLIVFTFPIFWMSVPAMLKGWIDRVFVSGIFYGGRRVYDQGGMRGKRALVAATLGGREHMFGPGALHGELHGSSGMLRSFLQGSLGYVGMEVLEPFIGYHIPYLNDEERGEILQQWISELGTLDQRKTLTMPRIEDFDDTLAPKAGQQSLKPVV